MQTTHDGAARFAEGSTAVRRDVLDGKVWSAAPHRVVHDSDTDLVLAHWPGIESLAPTTWIQWLRSGDEAVRKQAIPNLARGTWDLGRWVWRDTVLLSWFGADPDFSIHRYHDLGGNPLRWYVNFERPYRRTRIGIDTFDLLVDLLVAPDLSGWTWKDEDEYAQARRLGLINNTDHQRVQQARQRAVALVQDRAGPFGQDWSHWRVQPHWPLPVLPEDALALPEHLTDMPDARGSAFDL